MNPTCHVEPAAIPASLRDFLGGTLIRLDRIEWMDGAGMPQPYRDLLVHEREMTPTLEAFHGDGLRLNAMRVLEPAPNRYLREVLLLTKRLRHPVVYGVIEIYLDRFAAAEAAAIRAAHEPLGGIIGRSGMGCMSRPLGFFRYGATIPFFSPSAQICYGRYNQLLDTGGRPIARIFEIMAPVPEGAPRCR